MSGEHVREDGDLRRYFSQVPHLVIDDERLTRDDRALYVYYKRVAGEAGRCWQSNDTVAKRAGMSATLVKACRSRLVQFGYVTVDEQPGFPTTVAICDVWDQNMAAYTGGRVATTPIGEEPSEAGREATRGRAGRDQGAVGRRPRGGRVATPKKNPSRRNLEEEPVEEKPPTAGEVGQILADRHWIFQLYESVIGLVTGAVSAELEQLAGAYPDDWIKDAFEETRERNGRSLRYVSAILTRWASEGRRRKAVSRGPAPDDSSARAQFLRRAASPRRDRAAEARRLLEPDYSHSPMVSPDVAYS